MADLSSKLNSLIKMLLKMSPNLCKRILPIVVIIGLTYFSYSYWIFSDLILPFQDSKAIAYSVKDSAKKNGAVEKPCLEAKDSELPTTQIQVKAVDLPTTTISNAPSFTGIRDFFRYNCEDRIRIGGREEFVKAAPDSLYRVDGAWFVCFDKHLFLENNCTVLSFGINTDPSFDVELVDKYKCRVESFDPFIEADIFATARNKSPDSLQAASLKVKPNWSFHKTGIVATDQDANSLYSPGGYGSLNQILKYTNLTNKVIDVFKMDIEGGEWDFFDQIDMDYACKYFKQILFETHWRNIPDSNFENLVLLKKLEKCFWLFHRDTRFYAELESEQKWLTEFQRDIALNIRSYGRNDLEVIAYMLAVGELYFVNQNFL